MKRKNPLKFTVLLFLMMLLVISPMEIGDLELSVGADDSYAELAHEINVIMQDDRIAGATTGVSVRKADSGEIVYDHFGDTRLHPASNMKLFTAAAALETLGEDYQFTTEVHTDGALKGKVLQGNLYLKGKGDPTLLQEDFEQFAVELKSKGIQKIKGNLIGDDTWYDDVRLSSDITWDDESYYYGAQVSALTASPNADYDAGSVIVEVNPGDSEGVETKVTLTPQTEYVNIINNTTTVAADKKKTVTIEREHGSNNIIIEGEMPLESTRSREWIAVWEPSGYALDLFENALLAQGIQLIGNHKMKMGKTPVGTTLLAERKSMPMRELFIPFMKLSNNGHAEVLAKEMGQVVSGEGSWDAGMVIIEDVAADLGVNTKTVQLRDASGMSHLNLIPAHEITQLLYAVQSEGWYDTYLTSIPVAGEADRLVGGTLRNRMTSGAAKGNVTAKTGSLTGVSALGGYATTKDGELMIFSILINNDLTTVTPIEDAIANAIAEYSAE
ncbi:D-alanyl-D-alanine carboxypeptidase/D-alanyl-D-alanine endopeptidase [Sporosarcina sp. G11-34]|uniref:D-alanyl-D-alanine carboxypeptidase/D-alanyl-D-alanine endopeptidase n=1 Tax=Sporosarcina sp. G11-34 TaxID=2849605 RepID=UPI0022A9D422|nr:D-alanyl-D-alanine carboxypeptidase/D-alanyl-D-alanine-endopeptidase [Sporosarcina sp. G11-34]MCZ2257778.1 D-alanyl-D-alanine carboxypeptidase/D-alanyl-D-alanine-endopeptidase [Sporosarcina sp. G11-34]